MIKRLWIIVVLICCVPITTFSKSNPYILGVSHVPAAADESEESCTGGDCYWVSSWSGSDEQNTGTSYVWDSITDESDELALLNSAGSCFAGDEAKCLEYTASASFATAYVQGQRFI
jgi:hypothetical protein